MPHGRSLDFPWRAMPQQGLQRNAGEPAVVVDACCTSDVPGSAWAIGSLGICARKAEQGAGLPRHRSAAQRRSGQLPGRVSAIGSRAGQTARRHRAEINRARPEVVEGHALSCGAQECSRRHDGLWVAGVAVASSGDASDRQTANLVANTAKNHREAMPGDSLAAQNAANWSAICRCRSRNRSKKSLFL